MAMEISSPHEIVRRGILKITPTTVLGAVDSLDLRAGAKVSAVIGVPLRNLQQRRDVESFATSAPIAAVKALLELLATRPLEQVIEALGEHADAPSYDQLAAAIDELAARGMHRDEVVALLTFAIGEEFPASAHCRQLLGERPDWQLPNLRGATGAASLLSPKGVDPHVREQRRRRRDEEKQRKRAQPHQPPRPTRASAERSKKPVATSVPYPVQAPGASLERRPLALTPAEQREFSSEHSLVGAVVLAEIPFDAVDPLNPEQHSKQRPALVVGGADRRLLVRGIYSNPSATRAVFGPWRRLGMDHVSFITFERVAVTYEDHLDVPRLGQLNVQEWNSLA